MQAMPRLRYFRPLIMAGLITVALSWLMHLMAHGPTRGVDKLQQLQTIDFVRLKRNTELETRSRQKPPPPPPPPKAPPPPKLQISTAAPVQSPVPFAIPNVGLAPGVGGGPFIGAIGAPGGMGDGDIIPLVRISPQYPRSAAMDGIEGWVKIEFTVNPDGTVRNVKVVGSSPVGVFEQAAVTAAMKWKFKPKTVDGKAVDQRGIQELSFKLDKEE
jgi:protein TonB